MNAMMATSADDQDVLDAMAKALHYSPFTKKCSRNLNCVDP